MKEIVYIRDYPAPDDYGFDYERLLVSENTIVLTNKSSFWSFLQRADSCMITGFFDWRVFLMILLNKSTKIGFFPFASMNGYALKRRGEWRRILKEIYALLVVVIIYMRRRIRLFEFDPNSLNWRHYLIRERVFFYQLPLKQELNNPRQTYSSSKQIVFNGRMDVYQKGLDILCEEFLRYRKCVPLSNIKLTISGIAPPQRRYISGYNKFLRFLKNSEDITFLGALSENDRKEFLSNEDILAYPSRMDGTARPIREALLQGKDMLLSDGTGLGSWLNNQISSSIFWVNNKYRNSYLIAFYMIETTNQDGREVLSVKNQRELIKIAMSYA
jgi:hypothetical protein